MSLIHGICFCILSSPPQLVHIAARHSLVDPIFSLVLRPNVLERHRRATVSALSVERQLHLLPPSSPLRVRLGVCERWRRRPRVQHLHGVGHMHRRVPHAGHHAAQTRSGDAASEGEEAADEHDSEYGALTREGKIDRRGRRREAARHGRGRRRGI